MAAIIAQMTRANRERKKNKCFEIVIGKCMYEIGPFPERYEPEKHDKYLRAKKYLGVDREEVKILHRVVMQRLQDLKDEKRRNAPFKWRTFLCELSIMVLSLLLAPILMLTVELSWPIQEDIVF